MEQLSNNTEASESGSWKSRTTFTIGFFLGFIVCFCFFQFLNRGSAVLGEVKEIHSKNGILTNPLIGCESLNNKTVLGLRELEEKIRNYIEAQKKQGAASHISVYFRDLNNGPWFCIKEDEYFTPASLLKVPLMLAYFKKAEDDPAILSKTYKYVPRKDEIQQNFKPTLSLEEGKEYAVDDLITRMIMYSDNRAMGLLTENIEEKDINSVYQILGISFEDSFNVMGDIISVKEYASFFRVLFNASFLNEKYSEKALSLLTKTFYKNGLVAGVPEEIKVAHKFGERNNLEDNEKQLHDCGIVYYPNHPYLLCIMTRGNDYSALETVIQNIASKVYGDIHNSHSSNKSY